MLTWILTVLACVVCAGLLVGGIRLAVWLWGELGRMADDDPYDIDDPEYD